MNRFRETVLEQKLPHIGPRWGQKNLYFTGLISGLWLILHGAFVASRHHTDGCIDIEYTDRDCMKSFTLNTTDRCVTTRELVLLHTMHHPMIYYRLWDHDYLPTKPFNDTVRVLNPQGICICDSSSMKTGSCVASEHIENESITEADQRIWERPPLLRGMRRPWRKFTEDLSPGKYTVEISHRYPMRQKSARKFIEFCSNENTRRIHPMQGMTISLIGAAFCLIITLVYFFT